MLKKIKKTRTSRTSTRTSTVANTKNHSYNFSRKKRFLDFSRKRVSKTQKQEIFKELNRRYGIRIKPTNALTAVAGILIGYFGRNAALELFRHHVSVNIGKNDIATKNNATRNTVAVQTENATPAAPTHATRKTVQTEQDFKDIYVLDTENKYGWKQDPGGETTVDTHHDSSCPTPLRGWCPSALPVYCGHNEAIQENRGWCVKKEEACKKKVLRAITSNTVPQYYFSKKFRESRVADGNRMVKLSGARNAERGKAVGTTPYATSLTPQAK